MILKNNTDRVLSAVNFIGKKYDDIEKISLFGSRARGDNHSRSDYDIAVYFKNEPNYEPILEIEEIDTLLKVDVTVMNNNLSEKFLNNVFKEEKVIYMGKFADKYDNLKRAISRLQDLGQFDQFGEMEDIIRDSYIMRFEFSYELAWKTLAEYLVENGMRRENMPRMIFKSAYQNSIIDNEEIWLQMMKDRNFAAHEYDEEYIQQVANRVKNLYVREFVALAERLKE